MNLLVDEGVDRPIVVRLRQDGYNVLYVVTTHHKGMKTQKVDKLNS